ncbi:MAG: CBS domain-containing protein [Candidatus Marinimicrobia bacterium]|nr:CBS domain-containing protein [Candidatus Neomarinimicrobiota bacterium]
MSRTVASMLDQKGHEVKTTTGDVKALDAIKSMTEAGVGTLVVVNKSGRLSGILSERDFFRKMILQGKDPAQVPVKSIMTRKLIVVSKDKSVEECLTLMTNNRIRHLPVVDEEENLTGIVSIGDCVKFLLSEKDLMIQNLEKYIEGSI